MLLDGVVQLIAGFGLHQAGIGRADQGAEFDGGQAELAFAIGIEKQQRPARFIQPFETQHAEPRGHRQLRHYLGRHTAGGIGLAFHGETRFEIADRAGLTPSLLLPAARLHHGASTDK